MLQTVFIYLCYILSYFWLILYFGVKLCFTFCLHFIHLQFQGVCFLFDNIFEVSAAFYFSISLHLSIASTVSPCLLPSWISFLFLSFLPHHINNPFTLYLFYKSSLYFLIHKICSHQIRKPYVIGINMILHTFFIMFADLKNRVLDSQDNTGRKDAQTPELNTDTKLMVTTTSIVSRLIDQNSLFVILQPVSSPSFTISL